MKTFAFARSFSGEIDPDRIQMTRDLPPRYLFVKRYDTSYKEHFGDICWLIEVDSVEAAEAIIKRYYGKEQ